MFSSAIKGQHAMRSIHIYKLILLLFIVAVLVRSMGLVMIPKIDIFIKL